jgi:hypothetical protein
VDLRQSSDQHETVVAELLATAGVEPHYARLDEPARQQLLLGLLNDARVLRVPAAPYSAHTQSELAIFETARLMRSRYGEPAIRHYIISHTETVSDLLEVLLLQKEVALLRGTLDGAAMADLIGGNIPMVITVVPGAMPQVKAGRARLLAVTTGKRSSVLPDIPTIAESGLPGFEANNWYGVVVPAKTPQSIVARLNTELVKVLNSPGLRETYANQGIEAIPGTPAEFTAYIRSEIAKWGKIVKAAGIKAD